jgi:hypothetical protein
MSRLLEKLCLLPEARQLGRPNQSMHRPLPLRGTAGDFES